MKLLLIIDVADDVAEAYEDFTVDYDLRGIPKDDQKVNESIKYIEDAELRPLPQKKETYVFKDLEDMKMVRLLENVQVVGWNECLAEITGEAE